MTIAVTAQLRCGFIQALSARSAARLQTFRQFDGEKTLWAPETIMTSYGTSGLAEASDQIRRIAGDRWR